MQSRDFLFFPRKRVCYVKDAPASYGRRLTIAPCFRSGAKAAVKDAAAWGPKMCEGGLQHNGIAILAIPNGGKQFGHTLLCLFHHPSTTRAWWL